MVRLWQCGSVGMPCLGGSCNCTVGQGGQLQAYRFSELPRGFCRWGVRCEKRELPLPEGCCRDPGLCTDMLASELLALLSSLQKLVVFELESPEKTWLPKKVVPVKWKRGKKKKKDFLHQQIAPWLPELVKPDFLWTCGGKFGSVWSSLSSKLVV